MQDLLVEAMRRSGRRLPVTYHTWARALVVAQSTPHTAIFPLARSPERDVRFSWLIPLYAQHYTVFAREANAISGATAERLSRFRVAIVRGSPAAEMLARHRIDHILLEPDYAKAIARVLDGSADAVAGPGPIVQGVMAELGVTLADALTLDESTVWLGGSLDTTPAMVADLAAAIKKMRADGTYRNLLERYKLRAP
jgi:ABC-type amino acid transport substrate-binding protein